jgi:autotransporter passenger strand-loop-strand repeat protein
MTVLNSGGYFEEDIYADQIILLSNTVDSQGNSSTTSTVINGGPDIGTTVNDGGAQYVEDGGTASGATINSGGAQYVEDSGTASGTTVDSGGSETVFFGGVASNSVVSSGGYIYRERHGGITCHFRI